jgi:hypothetical protein
MLLSEILNRTSEKKVITDDQKSYIVSSIINGREIMFKANKAEKEDSGENDWDISFTEVQKNDKGVKSGTYGKTGNGGELEVFSVVKDCMRELITKHHPDKLIFTANKDGGKNNQARGNVYERLINRFKPPGYELKREEKTQAVDNGKFKKDSEKVYDFFTLVKI